MSAPAVKVNTFINRQQVDTISKVFILCHILFGINRISIIGNIKNIYVYLSIVYSVAINIFFLVSVAYISYGNLNYQFMCDVVKILLHTFLSYLLRGRLRMFYKEVNAFDRHIEYDVKISTSSIQNLVLLSFAIFSSCIFLFNCSIDKLPSYFKNRLYFLLPIRFANTLELFYISHLVGFMPPRLRSIIYNIKLSYPDNINSNCCMVGRKAFCKFEKRSKRKRRLEMGTLMDLYYNMVKAYDYLNSSVQWQLLLIVVMTFALSLMISYHLALNIINANFQIDILLLNISFAILDFVPVFGMCIFANKVRTEVYTLKDILSCCLYENSLDKTNRTATQAFLGLTEARDMTFSLFHMFNIDILLPLSFLGLLLTYLIILLQFNKVINPNPM